MYGTVSIEGYTLSGAAASALGPASAAEGVRFVAVKAPLENSAVIYVATSAVAAEAEAAGDAWPLEPGEQWGPYPLDNPAKVFAHADTASDRAIVTAIG